MKVSGKKGRVNFAQKEKNGLRHYVYLGKEGGRKRFTEWSQTHSGIWGNKS